MSYSSVCPLLLLFFCIVFSACNHWWICFLVWLLSSFFLPFFKFLIIFLNLKNFILFYLSFLPSFLPFLTFLMRRVADRVLMLWPGIRPVPLRWESRVQDMGPPETSWLHVISNSESSARDLLLNAKTQLHSTTSKLQCWTPHAKQLAGKEHNSTHKQRGCLKS